VYGRQHPDFCQTPVKLDSCLFVKLVVRNSGCDFVYRLSVTMYKAQCLYNQLFA